ncbi:MAG: hypothetical protein LBL87_08350 [Ruminococcus sp.]|jgi:hypothetical protein|nr:hypothetical protein [Ruminococcus sp.]
MARIFSDALGGFFRNLDYLFALFGNPLAKFALKAVNALPDAVFDSFVLFAFIPY